MSTLYEEDFYTWAQSQAHALRYHQVEMLDWEHLAEEVEGLGNEQEHAIERHFVILFAHLLKWRHQPERRGRSWITSIVLARQEIERRIRRNPGVVPKLDGLALSAYQDSRVLASAETGLPLEVFPVPAPWFWQEALTLNLEA